MELEFPRRQDQNGRTAFSDLHCIAVSHHTAPAEIRGALAFSAEEIQPALKSARLDAGLPRLVIISTCHRTELYADLSPGRDSPAHRYERREVESRLLEWLARNRGLSRTALENVARGYHGDSAVDHLFRLACGLESVIRGEPQIIAQVASAFSAAVSSHSVSPLLRTVFRSAVRAGEHARSRVWGRLRRADLGTAAAASAAKLLENNGTSLDRASVSIFGAGEVGELVLSALSEGGASNLTIVNRTPARALAIAGKYNARVRSLDDSAEVLSASDAAILALSTQRAPISVETLRSALISRDGRPLVLIDVGLPRNVDPGAGLLPGVRLVGIDQLGDTVSSLYADRAGVVPEVEAIIASMRQGLLEVSCATPRPAIVARA